MDDYIRALLLGQFSGVESQPVTMRNSLEIQAWEQPGKTDRHQEQSGAEGIAERLDAPELPETEPPKERAGTGWEETKVTALEETAGKQFLRRLEREIASLETGGHTSVILRQQEEAREGETREEVRIVGQVAVGEQVTPARLSRVFERDARRFQ